MITNDSISNICDYEYDNFLNKSNVIGISRGYKITGGFLTNELCISVFVRKKLPTTRLSCTDIISKTYKGIKTDVIETGDIRALGLTRKVRPRSLDIVLVHI